MATGIIKRSPSADNNLIFEGISIIAIPINKKFTAVDGSIFNGEENKTHNSGSLASAASCPVFIIW
jgi:hypothetical protein